MKKLKYIDKGLLIATTILFTLGLVMILSSSNIASFMSNKSPYAYLINQIGWLLIGTFLFAVIFLFSTKLFRKLSFLGVLILIFILILVLFQGKLINNARSWFSLFGFSFQPSEFLKIIYIVWAAHYYDRQKDRLDEYITVWYPLVFAGVAAFLIYLQPDLGTMIIYAAIVAMIFMVSPIKGLVKWKSIIVIMFIIGAFVAALMSGGLKSHQKSRFDLYAPCSEKKFYTTGNQLCNGYIAINNGGLFGKGLGNSTQKYLYIPEAHTDFIFAIVIEELGAVASIAIIGLIMIVVWRIVMIGKRSVNDFGAILCYAVASYIFVHTMVNLTGILGLLPMTGVPLPFLSYGGTFTISLIMALAFVQKVNIETKMKKQS